jgi:hypothetical protein
MNYNCGVLKFSKLSSDLNSRAQVIIVFSRSDPVEDTWGGGGGWGVSILHEFTKLISEDFAKDWHKIGILQQKINEDWHFFC